MAAVWPWGRKPSVAGGGGRCAAAGRSAADVPKWFGHAGIDLRVGAQLDVLAELEASSYQELFDALRTDAALSPGPDADGRLVRNGYFPSPDAELYAAMIVRERPRRIVEVGSGFSTRVARRALDWADLPSELHVVDPEPRTDVEDVADVVEMRRVEDGGLTIEAGTLLFIDSSHTMTHHGDGPYLFCDLLPSLPAGVLVHVHDIYLPYDYPAVYVRRGYTEQYALHALLAGAPGYEVVCTPYLLARRHPEAMRAAFGDAVARNHTFEGASFWMRTR